MPFLQYFSGTPSSHLLGDILPHLGIVRIPKPGWDLGRGFPDFSNRIMVQSEMFHWIFSSFTMFHEISLRDVHTKLKKSALVDAKIMILLIDFHRILIWGFPFKGGSTVSIVCSVVSRLSLLTLVFFSKEQQTHLLGVLGLGNLENNDP